MSNRLLGDEARPVYGVPSRLHEELVLVVPVATRPAEVCVVPVQAGRASVDAREHIPKRVEGDVLPMHCVGVGSVVVVL